MHYIYLWNSPIGMLKLCADKDHITEVSLLQNASDRNVLQNSVSHSDLLCEAYTQLQEYFAGKRMQFELPIHNADTAFQLHTAHPIPSTPDGCRHPLHTKLNDIVLLTFVFQYAFQSLCSIFNIFLHIFQCSYNIFNSSHLLSNRCGNSSSGLGRFFRHLL